MNRGVANQTTRSEHERLFTGTVRYVADDGADTNNGLNPDAPFGTIGAAIAASAAGDAITVKAGDYDEDGLDLTLDGMELWGEIGATIQNTTGTECLTVSGDSCLVMGIGFEQAGVIGIVIDGDDCSILDCEADGTTVGFDINGSNNHIEHCHCLTCTVTGYDIALAGNILEDCSTTAQGGASRGFYLSNAAADENIILRGISAGNATAGYEAVLGTENNVFADCISGGQDGHRVDSGTGNIWADFESHPDTDVHEDIYPIGLGQGVAVVPVTINNSTTDGAGGARQDQDYWGDIIAVIAPSVITEEWNSLGINIFASTTADIQQWEILFARTLFCSAQNAGNDWDENEVDLTVADGSIFEDGDYVWITGDDKVNGEILLVSGAPAGNVVTIARETTADAEAGVRYDYDVAPGNNVMYVVKRTGSQFFDGFEGDYSAGSARDFSRIMWHHLKRLEADTGMLMRMLNATDGNASTFDVRAIYED